MAALEQRPVPSSVNGDVDVNLDVQGHMTEEDVVDEEDIQKEVRTVVGCHFDDRLSPIPWCCLASSVCSDGRPVQLYMCEKLTAIRADD